MSDETRVAEQIGRLTGVLEGVGKKVDSLARDQARHLDKYADDREEQAGTNEALRSAVVQMGDALESIKGSIEELQRSPRSGFSMKALAGSGLAGGGLAQTLSALAGWFRGDGGAG